MPLRSQIRRVPGVRAVRAWQQSGPKQSDYHRPILTLREGNMKSEIEAVDFDVCIIGAGAYGLPLAAHAKKLGKMAVHLGGATQILFRIRGRRWDDHRIISKLYNEHWTHPKPWETPGRSNRVEGGAYW
jgi:NADPH-dependent 2,4-dienoyl-CoA reductase/sulfur reductase-like enzyme